MNDKTKPEAQGVAYFVADAYGGYWQTTVDGKPYNFRVPMMTPALSTPASHDAQQPEAAGALAGKGSMREALVHAEGRLSVYSKANPNDTELSCMILPMVRRALSAAPVAAQQPAVVGDGVHSLPAEWRATAARHRSRGTGQSVAQANGYDMAANMLEAALTPAATPGDDPVPWEWRWVDENDRAMTAWKRGDTPPMLDVSDSKGTMRVEVRIAQKEGNGNG